MRESSRGFLKEALSVLLVFILALTAALAPGLASASNSDLAIKDAESAVQSSKLSLDEAQTELDRITAEYQALDQEVQDMQGEIDKMATKVLEAQERMLAGREALGNAARQEYKSNASSVFLGMLLGSNSFEELTQNAQYITQIMDYQSDEVIEQKQLKADLDQAANELNTQKSEQEAKLNALEGKQAEAQDIVDRISGELDANKDKLDSLKQQAAAMKKQEQQVQQTTNPTPSGSSTPSNNKPSNPSSTSGWRSGKASAYGGSTDKNTNPNNLTAFGHVKVTESSMGVAIPMSWPNYRSYAGRTVEIQYNGKTVYATVDDCGGMGGGARHLDLQPGVFRAFGFSSCNDWGVRTVQYRFL